PPPRQRPPPRRPCTQGRGRWGNSPKVHPRDGLPAYAGVANLRDYRGTHRFSRRAMRTLFTAELSQLADDLVEMSEHVDQAIARASEALLTKNVELAQTVIADDAKLDELEQRVDERTVLLIAQQQPVGLD